MTNPTPEAAKASQPAVTPIKIPAKAVPEEKAVPNFTPYPLAEAREFVVADMQADFDYKFSSLESLMTIRKAQEEAYVASFITMEALQNRIEAQLELIEADGGLEKMDISRNMSLSHSGNDALNVQMVRLTNTIAQSKTAMETIDKHILALNELSNGKN